jgi:hypothetical protein
MSNSLMALFNALRKMKNSAEDEAEFWTAYDMMSTSRPEPEPEGQTERQAESKPVPKSKGKSKKEPKPEGTEPKKPNAWAAFVGQTVAEMKQSGWESFQSGDGTVWPASRREAEQYVYDGGEHDGKPPSHARGGMVRASYLRAQQNPEAEAKRKQKRSDPPAMVGGGGSTRSDAESGSVEPKKAGRPKMTEEQKAAAAAARAEKRSTGSTPSDAESASVGLEPKKAGRPKMTEEQKAAAKAKRAAKKAEGLNLKGEWAEMEAH